MLYSILISGPEDRVADWTPDETAAVLDRHAQLRAELQAEGRLGPVLRLAPAATSTTRITGAPLVVSDGPFAETKEQLMGIYVVDCATRADAEAVARRLAFDGASFELRPIDWFDPGSVAARIEPPT